MAAIDTMNRDHILDDAREWLMDLSFEDIEDPEEFRTMSTMRILKGIARFYDGGIAGFILDREYDA